ncbi:MAG: M23 family metallopeptidase [bacterium]
MNKHIISIIALLMLFFSLSFEMSSENYKLSFPLACTINKDCWISAYPDDDKSDGWHDYKGGTRTYNGHTGTDIAITDIKTMNKGVSVKAANSGVVLRTRDGVNDINDKRIGVETVNNFACGNGIVTDNGSGIKIAYCHMKKGSIKYKKGDFVKKGDVIGLVGMSGKTEYPHLHIQVFENSKLVDPNAENLWETKIPYNELFIYHIGVTDTMPDQLQCKEGGFNQQIISKNSNKIYLWADIFAPMINDKITYKIISPDKNMIANNSKIIEKNNVRRFLYMIHKSNLKQGLYTAIVTINRNKKSYSKLIEFNVK